MSIITILGIVGLVVCVSIKDTQKNRKIICILLCLFFILQAGLRDYEHATNDTYNYLRSYKLLLPISLSDVLESLAFKFNLDDYTMRDPGYTLFVKLTQIICPDFRFFLIVVATIISIPLVWIIYKFTNSLMGIAIASMIYEALFAGFFETGIRQTIAMGLIYFSLPFVIKRKWVPHYLMLIIAYFMHSSALIFIPFYPLTVIKTSRKFLTWAIILTPVFMMSASTIVAHIGSGTMFESYATTTIDNKGTPVFSALLFIVSIGAWIFRKRFSENDVLDRMLITSIVCSLLLMPTTWVNSNFIRLVFYYLVFLMPLVPRIISFIASNYTERAWMSIAVGIVLIILS